jgi:hypothetical protein
MYFNRLRALFTVSAAIVLATSACSVHEDPNATSQFNIKSAQLNCLDDTGAEIERFFEGTATDTDVNATWQCATHALQTFTNKVRGAQTGSYSLEELRVFLTKYFVHNITLTPELTARVGELKQALVGGDVDRVTDDEISELEQIFEVFRANSLKLRTFMPVVMNVKGCEKDCKWAGLGGRLWKDLSRQDINSFSDILKDGVAELANILQANGKPYSFAQASTLIQAIQNALPCTAEYANTQTTLKSFQSHLSLVAQLKTTLINPVYSGDSTSPDAPQMLTTGKDWGTVLNTTARWASLAVRVVWFTDADRQAKMGESMSKGAGLTSIGKYFDEVNSILVDVVTRHPKQLISFKEIEQLIGLIPTDILPASAANIDTVIRPLIRRFIGGDDLSATGREADGISLPILGHLHDIFYNWFEGQKFIETLYQKIALQNNDAPDQQYERDTLLKSTAAMQLWNDVQQTNSPLWNSNAKPAAARIRQIISVLRPLFDGNDGEITFPKNSEGLKYSFHDLSELNWMQTLSRAMIRGYVEKDPGESRIGPPVRANVDSAGTNPDPNAGKGVSLKEFSTFFADIRPLGLELHIFDPNTNNAAFSRFREGDAFTYVSDGNGYLDLSETSTLFAFAISAFRRADRIHDDIASKCPNQPTGDIYGKQLIDAVCYRSQFYGNFATYASGPANTAGYNGHEMDGLVNYFNNADPEAKAEFEKDFEVAARDNGYQELVPIDSGDTENFVGIMQYMEAIFTRYDVQSNGWLGPSEADVAFPVFKNVLEEMGRTLNPPQNLNDSTAELVFTYMLAKGEVPSTWDAIWWWVEKVLPWTDYKSDRLKLMQIFASLANASPSNPASNSGVSTSSR